MSGVADTPIWLAVLTPILTGVFALAGALGGTALSAHRVRQRDDLQWERQQAKDRADRRRQTLGELYLDLAELIGKLRHAAVRDHRAVPDPLIRAHTRPEASGPAHRTGEAVRQPGSH
jgi:hypothetical protein